MPDFEVLSFELIKLDLDYYINVCVGSDMGKIILHGDQAPIDSLARGMAHVPHASYACDMNSRASRVLESLLFL